MINSRIVVVHNYHDNERCRCLVKALRAVGYDVWYKKWGRLREGAFGEIKTQRPLPDGDVYLLIISSASWLSEQWRREILEALAKNKVVLPLLYEPTKIEGFLDLHHYLNVIGSDCSGVSRRVITELELIAVNRQGQPEADSESTTPSPKHGNGRPVYTILLGLMLLTILALGKSDMVASGSPPSPRVFPSPTASPVVYIGSSDRNVYALNASDGTLLWQHWIGGTSGPLNIVAVGGTEYVSTGSDGYVYALRARDGAEIWHHHFDDWIDYVMVANGIVYTSSDDLFRMLSAGPNTVCALRANSGDLLWCHDIIGVVQSSSLTVVGGVVYAATFFDYVYALRATDGRLLWSHKLKDFSSGLAVASGEVYVSSGNQLCAWRANGGELLWCYETGGEFASAPVVNSAVVYLGSDDGYVYAFTSMGKRIWKFRGQAGASPTNFVVAYGVVCAVFDDNHGNSETSYVYGLTESQGSMIWSYQREGRAAAPMARNGELYIGATDGIYANNLRTGALVWTYPNTTQPITSLLISDGGRIYFGSYDNYFYALSLNDGHLLWRFRTGGTVSSLVAA